MGEDPANTTETISELSVIVPSVNSYGDLAGVLDALMASENATLEILVVERLGADHRDRIAHQFPSVRVLPVPAGTPIPQMRAAAIQAARAPAVAVIEDHVLVGPDWARRMLDALGNGAHAVGGSVDNAATGTLTDWAAFLCEYSAILPPLPQGPSDWLPGNNVIYRRDVLVAQAAVLDEGKWENRLHDAIRASGGTLVMHPEIVVGHKMHYTFWLYLSQRYLYSRSYAGARLQGATLSRRFAYGLAAMALPPVAFYRVIRNVTRKRRHQRELARSIPMLVPFCLAWGLGEVAGAWLGPGNALAMAR